jgi:hypothetical protein
MRRLTLNSNINQTINQFEWLIQIDLGQRGIHQIPGNNLCTVTQGNLYRAIKFLAENPGCQVGIVTGFFIPTANPPAPENDGPPGALSMARGLNQLGYPVVMITDHYCKTALQQGIEIFKNQIGNSELIEFPFEDNEADLFENNFFRNHPHLKCLISIERVGPCYTMTSFLNSLPKPNKSAIAQFEKYGPGDLAAECLNMGSIPVTQYTAPLYRLFQHEHHPDNKIFTIGIGDGGNEIGMGSIPWLIIAKNILNGLGGKVACRISTDATIVAGVSNWAGYALIAGLFLYLNGRDDFLKLFSNKSETQLIETYYRTRSAVDGKLGCPAMSVDGINWEVHLEILDFIKMICRNSSR